jgi:beta-fructofuranosidase
VLIDKSVVEVFVNGRQCLALQVYPGRADRAGVSLHSLDLCQMKSIYSE